ncbi:MAG: flagellar basal body rod protein FlgB [Methylophilaceae bacterium]|nr:flagellar basal body rod protein FlgB [Methylophilaceae bacterium]
MNSIDRAFAFQEKVLALRGYRQQLLASNIVNADTPNYKAVDIDFAKALQMARTGREAVTLHKTSPRHLDAAGGAGIAGIKPMYRTAIQPSIDGNTVDAHFEQAQFTENALQYMATLQFINGKIKDTMAVLQGTK